MSVEECLSHAWLADESPERPLPVVDSVATVEQEEEQEIVQVVEEEEEEDNQHNKDVEEEAEEKSPKVSSPVQELMEKEDDEQVEPIVESLSSQNNQLSSSEEECASEGTSDKENSLVFNTLSNMSSNSSSCSSSSLEVLFPDAPTTPKVLRKTPSTETTPSSSVKALVHKFQVDAVNSKQQMMMVEKSPPPVILHHKQSACFVSQIPKLVHQSPRGSGQRFSAGSARGAGVVTGLLTLGKVGSNRPAFSSLDCSSSGSNRFLLDRKSGGGGASAANRSNNNSIVESPVKGAATETADQPEKSPQLKSPSARFAATAAVMPCVICGDFVCRHQTTVAAAVAAGRRKSMLGITEQRITC